MDYKTTSFDLKLALLQYFRFKRQWLCVDEFHGADIIVDTGKEIIEVEVKITKSDLINGERKKIRKHQLYQSEHSYLLCRPNKFMFCVPEKIVGVALGWVKEINERYGVIGFDVERFEKRVSENWGIYHCDNLRVAKSAKKLHEGYDNKLQRAIAKRTSSKIVGLMEKCFREDMAKLTTKVADNLKG